MHFVQILMASLAALAGGMAADTSSCPPFPSSVIEFSVDFEQLKPHLVKPEYKANFIQHKCFVRADEVFEGNLASSFFNYANVTEEGLVDNTVTNYSRNYIKPDVWRGYVDSNFPIFEQDILVKADAVFGGLVHRQFVEGRVAAWNIMYQSVIPVTIFVNNCNVVVGYDYFSPGLRTRVITEYFNIQVGTTSA